MPLVVNVGDRVRLRSLQGRPELNGCEGVCLSSDEAADRWLVKLENGTEVSVRPGNMEPILKEVPGIWLRQAPPSKPLLFQAGDADADAVCPAFPTVDGCAQTDPPAAKKAAAPAPKKVVKKPTADSKAVQTTEDWSTQAPAKPDAPGVKSLSVGREGTVCQPCLERMPKTKPKELRDGG
eukprot:TRINITY_DN16411_c0_g1_i4.p2 TRINITY_DN16411_c0_g1~~TRINITY_DN16411_c0_g1_i4.p2  ORF type:complete len:180 (+),score=50.64 TRINITY_DN16411_c0_g1_i4:113-652(+)